MRWMFIFTGERLTVSKAVTDQRPRDAERRSIAQFAGFLAIEVVSRL